MIWWSLVLTVELSQDSFKSELYCGGLMRITLGGDAATGKSDTAKLVAKYGRYRYMSVGELMRVWAHERGLDIATQAQQKSTEALDREADSRTEIFGLENDDFIYEGRLTALKIPHADLKIKLACSITVRANRRLKQLLEQGEQTDFETVKKKLLDRDNADRARFHSVYGIEDFLDDKYYTHVIDTENLNLESVAQIICRLANDIVRLSNRKAVLV